jgi:hypothetical protein
MKKLLFIAVMLLLLVGTVWADGVEVEVVKGNTVIPVQNNKVRMVSEEVTMVPAEDQNEINNVVKVNAKFVFENLTDQQISMKMGFPFYSSGPKGFKAWVQGKSVNVGKRPMGGKGEIVLQNEKSGFTLDIYIWDISFLGREKKDVNVEYFGGWGNQLSSNDYYFIYVVETGALWSDSIGKADFYLTLSKDAMRMLRDPRMKLQASPSGYIQKGDRIEWHFQDWEPKENLGVVIVDKSSSSQTSAEHSRMFKEGIVVTSKEEQPPVPDAVYRCAGYFKTKQHYDGNRRYYKTDELQRWYDDRFSDQDTMPQLCIKALRNEIYARHGRIFTTAEMKQIFEPAPWYKPRTAFKDSELNEVEKKNVELILDYEKKMGWR